MRPMASTHTRPQATAEEMVVVILAGLFAVALSAGFVGLIVFHQMNSKPLKLGLSSLSVSRFNISESEITAVWEVGFVAKNPNKAKVFGDYNYTDSILSILYRNQLLSTSVVQRIDVASKGSECFKANAIALDQRIDDSRVVCAIARDWSRGVVAFTVKLSMIDGRYKVNISCEDIRVGFFNHSNTNVGTMLLVQDQLQHSSNNSNRQAFVRCA